MTFSSATRRRSAACSSALFPALSDPSRGGARARPAPPSAAWATAFLTAVSNALNTRVPRSCASGTSADADISFTSAPTHSPERTTPSAGSPIASAAPPAAFNAADVLAFAAPPPSAAVAVAVAVALASPSSLAAAAAEATASTPAAGASPPLSPPLALKVNRSAVSCFSASSTSAHFSRILDTSWGARGNDMIVSGRSRAGWGVRRAGTRRATRGIVARAGGKLG
eukprot:30920-Pelagococcus_subviridis.AAC.29